MIPEEIFRKTEELIARQIGYYRGVWSDVVTEALNLLINTHTSAHIRVNPRPDVIEVFRDVIRWLVDTYYSATKQLPRIIPRSQLVEAIMSVKRIRDIRSINNWLNYFVANGLLKCSGNPRKAKVFEIVAP